MRSVPLSPQGYASGGGRAGTRGISATCSTDHISRKIGAKGGAVFREQDGPEQGFGLSESKGAVDTSRVDSDSPRIHGLKARRSCSVSNAWSCAAHPASTRLGASTPHNSRASTAAETERTGEQARMRTIPPHTTSRGRDRQSSGADSPHRHEHSRTQGEFTLPVPPGCFKCLISVRECVMGKAHHTPVGLPPALCSGVQSGTGHAARRHENPSWKGNRTE